MAFFEANCWLSNQYRIQMMRVLMVVCGFKVVFAIFSPIFGRK